MPSSRRARRASAVTALMLLAGPAAVRAEDGRGEQARRSCVDVRIGTEQYYSCLNEQLARQVPRQRPTAANAAPYSATSPAPQVGTFDEAATRERMGNTFGYSAFSQRPVQNFAPSPLIPTHR